MKKGQLSAGSLEIEFEGGLSKEVTAHAGAALWIETVRRSGVITAVDRLFPGKKNPKGLTHGQMVESLVLLSALAGECPDDLQTLRQDRGLEAMLGFKLPAPSTVRAWLDKFHDTAAMAARPSQGSFIPRESAHLAGLREVLRQAVRAYIAVIATSRQATLDVDAHLVESSKREARATYEGYRGFQPMIVTWGETGLILADQFRDGNVPASKDTAKVVDDAYDALPSRSDGWDVRVRSDSAAYEEPVLAHWVERGWKFAVSADMTPQLRQEIERVKIEEWHMWKVEERGFVREWAEVAYTPSRKAEKRNLQPYRFLAIRIRSPQGVLFSDGAGVKLFAVVTNDWEMGGRELLEWHRGKAGTVEHTHRWLKDELAAGVYPSGKFGANAAWLRLQALTSNLFLLFRVTALDEQYRNARPKRIRFAIFNHVAQVVRRAGQTLMQVYRDLLERVIGPGLRRLRSAPWQAA